MRTLTEAPQLLHGTPSPQANPETPNHHLPQTLRFSTPSLKLTPCLQRPESPPCRDSLASLFPSEEERKGGCGELSHGGPKGGDTEGQLNPEVSEQGVGRSGQGQEDEASGCGGDSR